MPSIDDLDGLHGLDAAADRRELTVSRPSDDVLASIKAEGGRRRARRHRRNSVIAGFAIAIVAVPAIVLLPGGEPDTDEVTVAADETTTTGETVRESTTVTTVMSTETTVAAAAPTEGTATPTTVRPTVTTVPLTTVPPLVCQNSTNPECGPFRWEPAPGPNQPLVASFAAAPAQGVVGQEVTFIVDWSDDDANSIDSAFSADGVGLGAPCSTTRRYGPWTPPAANPGAGSRSYTHTFTAPGTYTVAVDLWTGDVCDHPYASEAHLMTEITITGA